MTGLIRGILGVQTIPHMALDFPCVLRGLSLMERRTGRKVTLAQESQFGLSKTTS